MLIFENHCECILWKTVFYKASRKKPKNLTWSYDENISVYEAYAGLSAGGNTQEASRWKLTQLLEVSHIE